MALVGLIIPWTGLNSATFNVDSTADLADFSTGDGFCDTNDSGNDGPCTLRAAVQQSNASGGADTINLPAGTYNLTIPSASSDIDAAVGDLDISYGGLTISGAGAATTIVNQTTAHRVFNIPIDLFFAPIGAVTFQDFTIQGGNSSGLGSFNRAAGVQIGSRHPSLVTLRDMVVTGNNGAAAVSSNADLRIEDSTISGNTGNGVFLSNDGTSPGSNLRELDIIASTIDTNTGVGVSIFNADGGEIVNSTISGNGGSGLQAQYTLNDLFVTNTTIASNTANGIAPIGYLYIGSYIFPDIVVRNSIVSDNTAGDMRTPGSDTILPTSQGYNIIGDNSGAAAFTQTGDENNTDPLLQALTLNAPGANRTHALAIGSPAIDTASASFAPAADQRGVSRPQGSADDKGAYEFIPPSSDVSVSKTDGADTISAGDPVTYTIVVSNAGPDAVSGVTVTDTLPGTLSGASWTCMVANGATCGTSGTNDIDDTVDLPVGGSVTYTLNANLDVAATGTLVNTATAALPTGASDPNMSNNSAADSDTIIAAPMADLTVTKTDGSTFAIAGEQVTYTIVVSNSGPAGASGVAVVDTLAASLSSSTWTCVAAGGASCASNGTDDISDSADLPASSSATYTLTATLDPGATGTLENTATATVPSGTVDPNPGDNSAIDTDTIVPPLSADAGADRTTASGMPIDPDTETIVLGGMPSASGGSGSYTFDWSITPGVAGIDYTLSLATAANPDFTGHTEDTYTATLTVTDTNTNQAMDSALLEVVFPDQRDIFNEILTGTQTLGACNALTAEQTTIGAGADITFRAPLVELLNGFLVEDGAVFAIINGTPPECEG